MSSLRSIAGATAATLLALAGCGTMEPFSRGEPLEEETPDAGPGRPDAGRPDGGGDTDGGDTDGGDVEPAPAFRADVHPLLLDCTACHADGAGNFKVSGDAADDHAAVLPKLDLDTPENSLLLTKPTNQVDHQGGKLWDPQGAQAATVLAWIRAGAKDD